IVRVRNDHEMKKIPPIGSPAEKVSPSKQQPLPPNPERMKPPGPVKMKPTLSPAPLLGKTSIMALDMVNVGMLSADAIPARNKNKIGIAHRKRLMGCSFHVT